MTVFSKKRSRQKYGSIILDMVGVSRKTGQVGLEIEVEGNKFPKEGNTLSNNWKYTHDGSLRGQDNAEYIFKQPVMFSEVPEYLDGLWKMFDEYGSVLDDSNRTSVHVHLNVQDFYLNRLCSFLALYYSVEELLTAWCGDHRVGNLFCLTARDAPVLISKMKEFLRGDSPGFNEALHYGALNPHALMKFGSVEVRTMRGTTTPEPIVQWVSILERIYNLSAEYSDPRDVVAQFSGMGPMGFLEMVLGENTNSVVSEIPYDHGQIMEAMYTGIRFAQDLCYCREWSEYVPTPTDPFRRKSKAPNISDEAYLSAMSTFLQSGTISPNIAEPASWISGISAPPPIAINTLPAFHTLEEVEEESDNPADWFTDEYEGEDDE